jgi:hypothetical protein
LHDLAQREIPEVYKLKGHPNDVSIGILAYKWQMKF